QDRYRLGPPDPLLRAAALPDGQGPAHGRADLEHRCGARRRPRPVHGGRARAEGLRYRAEGRGGRGLRRAANGLGHSARPSLVIGWVSPRIPGIPIGNRIAARCQRVPSQSRLTDNVITPITTMATPSACSGRGTSSNRNAATTTANSGVKLLSAPEMLGPMRRLASNVSNVTVAGNNRPTRTKINAPRGSHPSQSSMTGASAESSSAEVGMLTDAPRLGGTWRRPNWVSTSARPNRKEAHSASACGSSGKSQPLTSDAETGARLCDPAGPKNW